MSFLYQRTITMSIPSYRCLTPIFTTHEIIKIIEDGWNQFVRLTFERPAENVVHIRKVSLDGAGKSTTSIDDLHVDIIIFTVLYFCSRPQVLR
jgi:hypothetical protein